MIITVQIDGFYLSWFSFNIDMHHPATNLAVGRQQNNEQEHEEPNNAAQQPNWRSEQPSA